MIKAIGYDNKENTETQSGYILSEDAEFRIRTIAQALDTMSALCLAAPESTTTDVQIQNITPILRAISWALGDMVNELPFGYDIPIVKN